MEDTNDSEGCRSQLPCTKTPLLILDRRAMRRLVHRTRVYKLFIRVLMRILDSIYDSRSSSSLQGTLLTFCATFLRLMFLSIRPHALDTLED